MSWLIVVKKKKKLHAPPVTSGHESSWPAAGHAEALALANYYEVQQTTQRNANTTSTEASSTMSVWVILCLKCCVQASTPQQGMEQHGPTGAAARRQVWSIRSAVPPGLTLQ